MKKKILIAPLALLTALALASCSKSETEDRNSKTPYGALDTSAVIASANINDEKVTLDFNTYYNKLRLKSYDIVTENMKKVLYSKEIKAVNELLTKEFSSASSETKETISYGDGWVVDAKFYNELKKYYTEALNDAFASTIFSNTSADSINDMKEKDIKVAIAKYKDATARRGNITESVTYTIDLDTDKVTFDINGLNQNEVDSQIISLAENLYARKKLYSIADQEYLEETDDDDNEKLIKNSNYLFNEDSYEGAYNSTYKTYGTYKAIIIQFNSRLEAEKTLAKVNSSLLESNPTQYYLDLYNNYYGYKEVTSADDERFTFVVNKDKNDLSDLTSSAKALITDTLEAGEYLKQPRNIDNKYIMAYHISSEFEIADEDGKAVEYDDLTDEQKSSYEVQLKKDLIEANASSYKNTSFSKAIEDSDLKIYDPIFEYKFQYTYTDQYELIDKDDFNNDNIFTLNNESYTVADFYNEATSKYSATIVAEHFNLNYAYIAADKNDEIDEDTLDDNEDTLDDAISNFNDDNNSTYPKEIGLNNYLTLAYGYDNKDDVLKYYFTANQCLSDYLGKTIFTEWENDGTMSQEAIDLFQEFLNSCNANYNNLFSMNVDHFLINIDDDGDGNPDDPDEFLKKNEKADFEAAVVDLARAIYKEAIYLSKENSDYSLYKILSYIKEQYNKGAKLISDDTKTWDDYKKYNFLITVEQLASSGDITQNSVANFVEPFADYLKGIQKEVKQQAEFEDDTVEYENGEFYLYNTVTKKGQAIKEDSDANLITTDTLCKTNYGYHVIVLNSLTKPDNFTFDSSDDIYKYQEVVKLLIEKDEDDEDNNIYATVTAWNETQEATKATVQQLFIYYIQSKNGSTSTLSDRIQTLISNLYSDAISLYNSSNFQTYLLMNSYKVESTNEVILNNLSAEKKYYANLSIDYDDESDFVSWITEAKFDVLNRPTTSTLGTLSTVTPDEEEKNPSTPSDTTTTTPTEGTTTPTEGTTTPTEGTTTPTEGTTTPTEGTTTPTEGTTTPTEGTTTPTEGTTTPTEGTTTEVAA